MEKRIKTKNIIVMVAGPSAKAGHGADGDIKEVGDTQILGSF
jgi:hypothetical protein